MEPGQKRGEGREGPEKKRKSDNYAESRTLINAFKRIVPRWWACFRFSSSLTNTITGIQLSPAANVEMGLSFCLRLAVEHSARGVLSQIPLRPVAQIANDSLMTVRRGD